MKRGFRLAAVGIVLLIEVCGALVAQTSVSAEGAIEAKSVGFVFPDGTAQTTRAGSGAPVADTGQRADQCLDEDGIPRGCIGTGEDGEHQAGVVWPTPRFADNGDGTVTDRLTGLVWLQDAECFGRLSWQEALDAVAAFAMGAHGCANYPLQVNPGWRLANISELTSLLDYGRQNPALPDGHPFIDVQPWYWSSSTWLPIPDAAWSLYTLVGTTPPRGKEGNNCVWPVRDGPTPGNQLAASDANLPGLATGTGVAQTSISVDGAIEATSGGFIFPDGSVQTTAATATLAPIQVTGQAECFDFSGTSRHCAGTGEDGEHQAGVAWPAPRFVDNRAGTITDTLTGLIWLQDAECFGQLTWQEALDAVAAFALGSQACTNYPLQVNPGWRLANVKELLSLIDFGQQDPALPEGHPFIDVQPLQYWSSSTWVPTPELAWIVHLPVGFAGPTPKDDTRLVWPVRGGR